MAPRLPFAERCPIRIWLPANRLAWRSEAGGVSSLSFLGSRLRCLAVGCVALALLVLPSLASAEIRQGTATDPIGDSAGAPSQDIVSATAQYDTNGQVTVNATMNGDIAGGPSSSLSFDVKSYAAPEQCTGSYVSMFGSTNSQYNLVIVSGVSGTGDSLIVRSGNTIGFGASGTALRNRDYSCMTLRVSRVFADGGGIVDQLNVPLFFDGFGPDTDADGLKDNQDKCPSEFGPAPTGCAPDTDGDGVKDNGDQCPGAVGPAPTGCPVVVPPASAPAPAGSTRTCSPRSLKGKSLSAARTALKKAGCKLGKVTRPKKLKRGYKLVVKKQKTSGETVDLVLAAKKKSS